MKGSQGNEHGGNKDRASDTKGHRLRAGGGGDQVGPDTQCRQEDEGYTRVPVKLLRPFRNQQPDLRGNLKRNEKARGESNKRAEASAPNTRSAVDARPVMSNESNCPRPRKVVDIGDKGGT